MPSASSKRWKEVIDVRKPLRMIAALTVALTLGSAAAATADPMPPVALSESQGAQILTSPPEVVRANQGATVELPVGSSFALHLGEAPPDWQVTVDDQSILSRKPNILTVRGVQGIYEAHAVGTTTLMATGTFPCQTATPIHCMIAVPAFRITVVVRPAQPKHSSFTLGNPAVLMDDLTVPTDAPAFLASNRAYVPVRYLAESLGVADSDVVWDGATQKVTLTQGSTKVALQVGSTSMQVGNTTTVTEVAPVLRAGRVYVPARWVAEAFGTHVGWDGINQTVTLDR